MSRGAQNVKPSIARLKNVARLMAAVERVENRAEHLPGLICVYGYSGLGKSTAAALVANTFRATYLEAKSYWTQKVFLENLLRELGDPKPRGTIASLAEEASRLLADLRRPLIIDELDHIVAKGYVELIRDILRTRRFRSS